MKLFSRGLREFTLLSHIKEEVAILLSLVKDFRFAGQTDQEEEKDATGEPLISDGIFFDGELYNHNRSLQEINSLVRGSD